MRIERRPYRVAEAVGYEFVVPATGDEAVDRRVTTDAARPAGVWSTASVDYIRAVHLPAVHRQGLVTVAVSTGGRSPALARWLRTGSPICPDPSSPCWQRCWLPHERRSSGLDPADIDWSDLIDQVVPLVEQGRVDEARATLERLGQLGRR